MTLVDKMRAFGRMLLMLFILASVAFLSALTAMRIAIEGRQVKMPSVVGKSVTEAEHTLTPDGLGLRIEDRVFSDYPLDVIVRQSPPAGLKVKTGERAHVVVSLGPQRVVIPDLRSASLRAARVQLLRDGLQMGETSSVYLPGSPTDTVLMQTPPAGALDAASPRVNILVSMGEAAAAWVMPNVTGIAAPEAARELSEDGLRNLKIVSEPPAQQSAPAAAAAANTGASNIPAAGTASAASPQRGTVIGQAPAAGSQVEESTQIELQVAE